MFLKNKKWGRQRGSTERNEWNVRVVTRISLGETPRGWYPGVLNLDMCVSQSWCYCEFTSRILVREIRRWVTRDQVSSVTPDCNYYVSNIIMMTFSILDLVYPNTLDRDIHHDTHIGVEISYISHLRSSFRKMLYWIVFVDQYLIHTLLY